MTLRGLFITGTDTGVGKTCITCLIARELIAKGLRVGIYKPACSGSEIGRNGEPVWDDLEAYREVLGHSIPLDLLCSQRFHAPLAPPVAARLEGRSVDAALLREGAARWRGRADVLLIEGAGGLLCPLTERETVADLAADLRLPLVIVARLGLGTINHTLLTVEVARRRGLPIAGIVLNQAQPNESDESVATNPREIAARCDVPILGIVPHGGRGGLRDHGPLFTMDWCRLVGGD